MNTNKTIFFDMYQTLVYTDTQDKKELTRTAFENVFVPYLLAQGVEEGKAQQFHDYYKEAQNIFYEGKDKNLEHHNFEELLLNLFSEKYTLNVPENDLIDMIYDFRKHTRGDTNVYPGIQEALAQLSKEYTLIVASYTQGVYSKRELEEFGIAKYFKDFIFSSEIGYKKASDEFWKNCIEVSGGKAEDCIMVGDNLDEDIYMASKNGMKTVWVINPLTKEKNTHNVQPGFSIPIENIIDLPEVIKQVH